MNPGEHNDNTPIFRQDIAIVTNPSGAVKNVVHELQVSFVTDSKPIFIVILGKSKVRSVLMPCKSNCALRLSDEEFESIFVRFRGEATFILLESCDYSNHVSFE